MKLEEAKEILNWSQQQMRLGNLPDYSQNVYQAEIVVLQELEHLQKENEEYSKQLDLDYVDKNFVSKDKIREKIEYLKLNCGHAFVIDALEDLLKEE
jgi:hypothetical protein